MRLSYLAYFHHAVYLFAILAALFFGMIMQYNIIKEVQHAAKDGENKALIEVYTGMSLKGLSEIGV